MTCSISETSSTSPISKIGSQLSCDSNKLTKYKPIDGKLEKSSLPSHSSSNKSSCQLEDLKISKLQQINLSSSLISNVKKCKFCLESHEIYVCDSYLSNTPRRRCDVVSKLKLCRNCLIPSHKAINCRNDKRCKECNKKHHTILHFTKPSIESNDKELIYRILNSLVKPYAIIHLM